MTTAFQGTPVTLEGTIPAVGTAAPDFKLTAADLSDKTLASYEGKIKVFSVTPSLDTSVCALSAVRFAKEAEKLRDKGVIIINVSADLPFVFTRGCEATAGFEKLSTFRGCFPYGLKMTSGPLEGLYARAVIVVDKDNKVVYTQLCPEITKEPNYTEVLEAVKKLL